MDRVSASFSAFCILGILLCSEFQLAISIPPQALAVIRQKEQLVQRLADEASSLFRRRSKVAKDCECSSHICNGITSQRECKATLRMSPQLCGSKCKMDRAGPAIVRTPPFANVQDLSSEMKEAICVYKNIESEFRELLPRPNTSTELIARDGHSHLYPALDVLWKAPKPDKETGNCEDYEPRLTPQYIGALTGPKDIIFILDNSRAMNRKTNDSLAMGWNVVRDTLTSVLSTLSAFDLVGVVTMSKEAQTIGNRSTLASATRAQIRSITQELLETEPTSDLSNPEDAFETAFQLLIRTSKKRQRRGKYLGGQKVIVLLTGSSRAGSGRNSASRILRRIETLQLELHNTTGRHAAVFSYSIGSKGNGAFPQRLACENHGAWFPVNSAENLLWTLTSHNIFLGANQVTENPVWTNPRKRPGGEGWISTVSKAFYFMSSSGKDSVFLGVVAHAVAIREITSAGARLDQIRKTLVRRSRRNSNNERSPCLLQVYRNIYANRSFCVDSLPSLKSKAPESEDADQYEQGCFEFEGRYYKAFDGPSNWTFARSSCEEDGGVFATGVSKKELQFLSGLASVDGTWIGARRRRVNKPFLWDGVNAPPINVSSTTRSKDDDSMENCVQLDNREVNGKLLAAPCSRKLSFICVYEKLKRCGVLKPRPKRGYFTTPPLDTCIQEEVSLANVAPNSGSANVPSSHVLCTANRVKESESLCCQRCSSEE